MDAKGIVELAALTLVGLTIAWVLSSRGDKGIGLRAIQFTAVPTVPAFLVILGLEHLIDACVIATVLGVLVGYLFSKSAFSKDKED